MHAGISFGSRNVLADPIVREGIKKFTSWPTIPQVRSAQTMSLTDETTMMCASTF
jgi:glutaredoxin-related protein